MFNDDRYITKGIEENIPPYISNILWFLIETMNVEKKDFLQVFHLEHANLQGKVRQKIIHIQEQPCYSNVHFISAKSPICAKIVVIDDGKYSTMLLSDEL